MKQTTHYHVAILGHHGVPSNYGGFEAFAEGIGKTLVKLGCNVVAYCRSNYYKERNTEYQGIKLVYLPTIVNKYLDTALHSFLSIIHVIIKNTADIIIIVNVGNAPFVWIAKLFGKKVIFCVDGLDWERRKWNWFARWYLKTCSYVVPYVAHEIITDALSVWEFYRTDRRTESTFIPYGTEVDQHTAQKSILDELKLKNKYYFIYVARFEPENNPLEVVEAYVASKSTLPLIMIGDNIYNPNYVKKVKEAANSNVQFLGYVFGRRYKELVNGALAYIRAAEVGGSSPATIEAMGRNTCVIANDKSENREVLGDTAFYYNLKNIQTLIDLFKNISQNPETALEQGRRAGKRAKTIYSWERIGEEYLEVIRKLTSQNRRNRRKDMAVKMRAYSKHSLD